MNKKNILAGIILLIAISGLLVYWFLHTFEYVEKEIYTASSHKARRNPFLAAVRYLKKTGLQAESVSGRDHLITLPPESDLIFINNMTGNLPKEREDKLITWIEQGGCLVITASRFWDEDLEKSGNTLLDRYNIRLQENKNNFDDTDEQKKDNSQTESEDYHETANLFIPGYNDSLSVEFIRNRTLDNSDNYAVKYLSKIQSDHLLQFKVGQGIITVLSDNSFLRNENIGNHDHALLLSVLSRGKSKVWILTSSNMPSLLSILWNNFPHLVICTVLLALFSILRLMQTTGPKRDQTDRYGRNIMEHLEASGRYLYGADQGKSMLITAQKSTRSHWKKRHLFMTAKSHKERSIWIAKRTGLSEKAVYDALYTETVDDRDFIKKSAMLSKLNACLKRK